MTKEEIAKAIADSLAKAKDKTYQDTIKSNYKDARELTFVPFDMVSGGKGSYGEENAFEAINYLKNLRTQLDEGTISVSQFLKEGKKAAEFVQDEYHRIGGQGSRAGGTTSRLVQEFNAAKGGFTFDPSGNKVQTALPEEYQERLREELIPDNITGAEREELLKSIPTDIGFDTDRFAIEREGVRQRFQQEDTAKKQSDLRAQRLKDLAGLLSTQKTQLFDRNKPQIAEQAQAEGLFNTSGYGEGLARYQTQLDENIANILAQQGIADRDVDINALSTALATQQSYQGQGLSREFSTNDYTKQLTDAMRYGQMMTPSKPSGKGGGGGAAQGAGAGAAIGTQIMPGWGTAIGAGVGAIGGYFAGKK